MKTNDLTDNQEGGFFDLDPMEICNHINHLPPMYLWIPEVKGYRHICPKCGKVTVLTNPKITCMQS